MIQQPHAQAIRRTSRLKPIQRAGLKALARRRFARRLFRKFRPDQLHLALVLRLGHPLQAIRH